MRASPGQGQAAQGGAEGRGSGQRREGKWRGTDREPRGGREGRGPDREACWAGRLPTEVPTGAEWGGGRRRKEA